MLIHLTALPETGPRISGGRKTYYRGDIVRVNCTSARSKPAAKLHWFFNSQPVIRINKIYFYFANPFIFISFILRSYLNTRYFLIATLYTINRKLLFQLQEVIEISKLFYAIQISFCLI